MCSLSCWLCSNREGRAPCLAPFVTKEVYAAMVREPAFVVSRTWVQFLFTLSELYCSELSSSNKPDKNPPDKGGHHWTESIKVPKQATLAHMIRNTLHCNPLSKATLKWPVGFTVLVCTSFSLFCLSRPPPHPSSLDLLCYRMRHYSILEASIKASLVF